MIGRQRYKSYNGTQERLRSACTIVQADMSLFWVHITSYVLPCVDVALLYRGLIVYINLNEQFDVGLFCILILSCSDLSVHWRVINL